MPDEKGYVSQIVDPTTALRYLGGTERVVVDKAFQLWRADAQLEAWMIRDAEKRAERKEQERIKQTNEAAGESSTAHIGLTNSLRRSPKDRPEVSQDHAPIISGNMDILP